MRYFDLFDNMRIPERWALRSPVDEIGQEVDPWQFGKGRRLELQDTLRLPVARTGRALDFTSTGLAIPIVSRRMVSLFERLGLQHQVQFFPAQVEGQAEPYFILNILRVIRCIDEARSEEIHHWKPEDGNPEKVGQYRVVSGMRIDPTQVGDAHIFRPWGWRVVIVVSEYLKQAMEEEGITGPRFIEV
ncbi:MAG TPA: DUF1629 domain-containing protein [Hyalangium sp.]|nr:DUF1629 domain-containing protein [Hyalangium sp.]